MPADQTQHSAFKQLYTEVIKNGGEVSKLFAETYPKKQIKCYVKESFPHFLVTDGFFFVPCYFTKKAVDEFKNKFSSLQITDLKNHVIVITQWDLEVFRVNSVDVFTSYSGVEVRLIVKGFKHLQHEKEKVSLTRYPTNLFRDDEIKALIRTHIHKNLTDTVKTGMKSDSLPDITKFNSKNNVSQGIVNVHGNLHSNFGFKEGKTTTVDINIIYKLEKGSTALKRVLNGTSSAQGGKVKATGGSKNKRNAKAHSKQSGDVKRIAEKIQKFTPGGTSTTAKRSAQRLHTGRTPTMPSPGAGSQAGTTNHQSMEDFKKMIAYFNKRVKQGKSPQQNSGKLSHGKRTGSKINSKLMKSGKKSQK